MLSLQGLVANQLSQQEELPEKYEDLNLIPKSTLTIVPDKSDAVIIINGKQTNSIKIPSGSQVSYSVEWQGCRKTGSLTLNSSQTLNIQMLPFDTVPKMTGYTTPEGLVEESSCYGIGSEGWRCFDRSGGVSQGAGDSPLTVTYTYAREQYAGTYYVTYTGHPGWWENPPATMTVSVYGTDNQWHEIKKWTGMGGEGTGRKHEQSNISIPVNFTKVRFAGTQYKYTAECGWTAAQLRRTA